MYFVLFFWNNTCTATNSTSSVAENVLHLEKMSESSENSKESFVASPAEWNESHQMRPFYLRASGEMRGAFVGREAGKHLLLMTLLTASFQTEFFRSGTQEAALFTASARQTASTQKTRSPCSHSPRHINHLSQGTLFFQNCLMIKTWSQLFMRKYT